MLILQLFEMNALDAKFLSICIFFNNSDISLPYLITLEPSLRPLSSVKSLPVKDLSCSFQTSSSFSTSPTVVRSITDDDVDVHKDVEIEMNLPSLIPTERCIRRAEALRRELHMAGSLDCVTQLGRQLFCLDVLT